MSTFAIVERRAEQAVTFFYSHLFRHHPGMRALFPEDLRPQRDRLFAALTHVVAHLDDPGLPAYLGRLGRDHRKFLATPALYSAVGASLLAALARTAGPAWTPDAEKSWTEAYTLVADLMMRGAQEAEQAGEPAWWDADVVRHVRHGDDLAVLTLRPRRPFTYAPGQYAGVSSPRAPRIWRTYSLANAPRQDGTVDLHVSRIRGGRMSTALVDEVRAGETLRLSAPGGATVHRTEAGAPRTYIAAGTGWAPVKALLEELALCGPGETEARLFLVARAREYLYGRPDLDRLGVRIPGLRVTCIAAAPRHPRAQATERLLQALPRHRDWGQHDVYVAGPPGFLAETAQALEALGATRIFHDRLPALGQARPLSPAERLLSPRDVPWHDPEARAPRGERA